MRLMNWLAAVAAGLLLAVVPAPAAAQQYSSFPTASSLAGTDFLNGIQGTGCATGVAPCANAKITPAQIAAFVATASPITSAYQPLDSDLTAIAALSTTGFGRSLLTQADAPTARTTLGAQASSTPLTQIAGLSPADGDFLERVSGAWVNRTAAQVKQDLGIGYTLCKSAVPAALTGSTSETTLMTCTVPANAMGPNGQIEIFALFSYTNSANSKTLKAKFGGTTLVTGSATTSNALQGYFRIANRNAANSQVANPSGSLTGIGTSTSAPATSAIDTTASTTITLTGQLATSSETITLESYIVRVIFGA